MYALRGAAVLLFSVLLRSYALGPEMKKTLLFPLSIYPFVRGFFNPQSKQEFTISVSLCTNDGKYGAMPLHLQKDNMITRKRRLYALHFSSAFPAVHNYNIVKRMRPLFLYCQK